MSNSQKVKLKPNDFIYTPDEETFNRTVEAFVEAGAELSPSWCSWDYQQCVCGVVFCAYRGVVSHHYLIPSYNLVPLDDL